MSASARSLSRVLILLAVLLVGVTPVAVALNVVAVTITDDVVDGGDGETSLREAFDTANSDADDTEIVLQAGATYELGLCNGSEDANASGDLDHTANQAFTITGNGATIEQTCEDERVIHHHGTGMLTVNAVTVTGGNLASTSGAGIGTETGAVTVRDSTITANTAGGGGSGGGIDVTSDGALLVERSTISGNMAGDTGGGIRSFGEVEITRSTIAGNTSSAFGGGIETGQGGPLTMVNSTVADNTSTGEAGGGIFGHEVTLIHVTVVENTAGTGANLALPGAGEEGVGTTQVGPELIAFGTVVGLPQGGGDDCLIPDGATVTSTGYNVDSDGSCGFGGGPGDEPNTADPGLGPLQDNGGPTQTREPVEGSPLVDAIPPGDCSPSAPIDQRGVGRPQGEGCDIGAVEVAVQAARPVEGEPTFTG